jgi:hypothetical protein
MKSRLGITSKFLLRVVCFWVDWLWYGVVVQKDNRFPSFSLIVGWVVRRCSVQLTLSDSCKLKKYRMVEVDGYGFISSLRSEMMCSRARGNEWVDELYS